MYTTPPRNFSRRHHQRGFTLLELMVAIAIFAVISVIAYSGLNNILATQHALEKQSDRIGRLQKAFMIIARDLEQVVDREALDGFGSPQAAMFTEQYGDKLLAFTRNGWNNPFPVAARPRSNLQRVVYSLKEQRLIRSHYDVLDQAPDSVQYDSPLLEKVTSVKVRFLQVIVDRRGAKEDKWHDKWPLDEIERADTPHLPNAVEITIDLEDSGEIQRLFALPGAMS